MDCGIPMVDMRTDTKLDANMDMESKLDDEKERQWDIQ